MSVSRKRKAPPFTDAQLGTYPSGKPPKRCDRRGCDHFSSYPFCFVQASERCARSGYTSRWYHLSAGQHFCNECFEYFYRSNKPGNSLYTQWCSVWEKEAGDRVLAGPKIFFADQYLPVWVQCQREECQRWRKLPPAIELHHVKQDIVRCSSCQMPEDEVVEMVLEPDWINTVSYTPLLRFSVLAPLLSEYFPDGVGISPSTVRHVPRGSIPTEPPKGEPHPSQEGGGAKTEEGVVDKKLNGPLILPPHLLDPLHPFHHPQEGPRARAFTPDVMETEEKRAFPEYSKPCEGNTKGHSPKIEIFCILRNIILALWFRNCQDYLTEERCSRAVSLRGVVRIWCHHELPHILRYLTEQGYVNHGFLQSCPRPFPFVQDLEQKSSVLVIGAGSAGLATAHHLRNFGNKVTILEASGRIGGRVQDDFSMGPCVGMGAMFITGICNNPLTLLSRQLGIDLWTTEEDRCELINEKGQLSDKQVDAGVEKHFNSALDKLSAWRRGKRTDESLGAKLDDLHEAVLMEQGNGLHYNEEEARLLDFHYSNLEFACGATLNKVSACHWDHNDTFSQFAGCHALLPEGFLSILSRLAEGAEIHFNTPVQEVELRGEGGVVVVDTKGREWTADKVVVTVPLAVLQSGTITFTPPLSERKGGAIRRLGAGLVEKVAMSFSAPFWRNTVGNTDFFGHVASRSEHRGMFGLFYDMSPRNKDGRRPDYGASAEDGRAQTYILVTTISGEALGDYERMTDGEVIELCVRTLKLMFPKEAIPHPDKYVMSRWGAEPYIRMSYSYVAVGSSGADYDTLAEDVAGRIFFAGEATNRQHPQTVTGAYLSGIREACKIIRSDKLR